MKKHLLYFLLFFSAAALNPAIAQPPPPNCPPALSAGFDITGDSISLCADGVNLTVQGFSTLNSTDSYSVDPIPYNPYPWVGTNSVIVGSDDIWSGVVPLPFDFCFFGQKYTGIVIGSNGRISFDLSLANGADAWNLDNPVITAPDPVNNSMNNTIMAPYHDTHPGSTAIPTGFTANPAKITWDIYGTAPCRYMVVSWDSLPMFLCNDSLVAQQIVLFESTYLIDINIRNKPICANWNGGRAIEGLQNTAGTSAFLVPGRNSTQWAVTNDSYRFTPAGTNTVNYLYTWIDVPTNTVLGTGPTLSSYMPLGDSNSQITVLCQAITDCDTLDAGLADTIDVIVTGLVTADFEFELFLGCDEDTVVFTNTSINGTTGNINYLWDFGDASFSSQVNPTHIYGAQQVYNVELKADANGCLDSITKAVDVRHPITAAFSTAPDSICLGQPTTISNLSQSLFPNSFFLFDNYWDFGDGNTGVNNAGIFDHIYQSPGIYTIKLIITDTLGCQDSISSVVFVDEPPYIEMTASPTEICVGNPVYFIDTAAPHTLSTQYNFDDGTILSNLHNPTHVFQNGGIYNVTFTGFYAICPDSVITRTITVNDYPLINLGDDVDFCPGVTESVTLTNTLNSSQILDWSDGSQGPSLTVSDPGYYWAQSSNGVCTTADSIWVKRDCYLNIPNSFSPTGDGLNDYFIPRQLLSAGLSAFDMKIFNRWGEVVFQTDRIDGRGWDGKYGGVDQPLGVYVYVIEAGWKNGHKNTFQGNVTLLR